MPDAPPVSRRDRVEFPADGIGRLTGTVDRLAYDRDSSWAIVVVPGRGEFSVDTSDVKILDPDPTGGRRWD